MKCPNKELGLLAFRGLNLSAEDTQHFSAGTR